MRRLVPVLVAVVLTSASVSVASPVLPASAATPTPTPAAVASVHDGTLLARGFGGYRGSSRRGFGSGGRYGYRRPHRGHGFLRGLFHGLFWGWLLSHLFGGGFPLILPLLLLVVVLVAMRRRRPRPSYRG
jgi:uncharacterized membrane protein